ncbi:uncharacterized protein LOC113316099 [Papaver somniferum]|uniref:uncharacterized protein LOC113316099 n=1 Tax=Papaver somniferum TaxID=3469 RepID=UPI000E6FD5BD|nr:uncharacterized protein LOC113316099 [Papaver somniferum]
MGENHDLGYSNSSLISAAFADMVKGKKTLKPTTIDIGSLPNPIFHDNKPSMELPLEFFQEGCAIWNHSLIGRLHLKAKSFDVVTKSLEDQWNLGPGKVKFTPMNKGFFIIKFSSEEDKVKIRDGKTWKINQQELRLQDWFPWFDPDKESSSHATVWVNFPGLYVELWTEKILLSLGKNLGNPIMVDKKTLNRDYGCYATVLVDIDFVKTVPDSIHVTVGGRSFEQFVELQKIPKFFSHCKIFGHVESDCRQKTKKNHHVNPTKSIQKWQPVKDKIMQGATNVHSTIFVENNPVQLR